MIEWISLGFMIVGASMIVMSSFAKPSGINPRFDRNPKAALIKGGAALIVVGLGLLAFRA